MKELIEIVHHDKYFFFYTVDIYFIVVLDIIEPSQFK